MDMRNYQQATRHIKWLDTHPIDSIGIHYNKHSHHALDTQVCGPRNDIASLRMSTALDTYTTAVTVACAVGGIRARTARLYSVALSALTAVTRP